MFKHKKVVYNPYATSVPVPIIAHSGEIVLTVEVARELYKYLMANVPIPYLLRKKLLHLYTHTPSL
jgi:hypothetical protein